MFSKICVAVAAVATIAMGVGPATAAPLRLPGTIDLPCASGSLRQRAGWYLPDGPARGLVWLQHGFARSNDNVESLAETLSSAGYLVFAPSLPFVDLAGCTLQNLGDNTPFLAGIAELFTTAADPRGALALSLADAAPHMGRAAPDLPPDIVFIGHSAGAEAIEYVAHRLHATRSAAWPHLRGLVLLDPVKSFLGNNTDASLTDLDPTGLPILTISGPPGLCNNFGSGTTAIRTLLHRPFVGVRLPSGAHTDAEGASSDAVGELACGVPQSANVAALQRLALTWTDDFFIGSDDYARDVDPPVLADAEPLAGA